MAKKKTPAKVKTPAKDKPNGLGIASLVLGIVSIVLFWLPFIGIVMGIVGIILSGKQKKISPNGIATGGLVTSSIGLVISIIYTLFWIIALVTLKSVMM